MIHPQILNHPDVGCPSCGNTRQLLTSPTNPRASEWYCSPCHESQRIPESEAVQLIVLEAEMALREYIARGGQSAELPELEKRIGFGRRYLIPAHQRVQASPNRP